MEDKEKEILEKKYKRVKSDLNDIQKYVDELTVFLPLSFCNVNPLDLILGVNNYFQKITGYKEMEVVGNSIDFLFLEKEKIKEFKNKVLKREEVSNKEFTLVKKNGDFMPVNVSALARIDENNNFLGYFLTISDITEIKDFQNKLEKEVKRKTKALENKTKELADSQKAILNILEDTEESRKEAEDEKNKTKTIIANYTDGLLVFDKNNTVDIINPEALKILSIENTDGFLGKSLKELKENESTKDLAEALIQSPDFKDDVKRPSDSGEFRKEIKNKKDLIIEVTTVAVFEKGKKEITLAVLHDITREKMIEEMKSEFVSIAAHQLRTPLSAIKWTMKMLIDGDLGKLNKNQLELAEKAYISNTRMVNLINDLLNVSRIEEGRYLYKPSHVAFNEIIDPLLSNYKEEIKRRGIKFEIDKTEKQLPKIAVDIEKITLVVQNFLDNAMKYTSKGGNIVFSVVLKNKKIEVSVTDSGVGIPENQKGRLFSKFFRAENVVRMETEGSGLGLFICKNIIKAHKGEIWFESKEGQGSTFYFTLPIIETKKEFEEFLKKL